MVATQHDETEVQSFGFHVGDYIEVEITIYFSNVWVKFLDSLGGLADPSRSAIKQHLEKELVARDIYTAFASTEEMTHEAVRADARMPLPHDKHFDFDVDPAFVQIVGDSFDCLHETQDLIDLFDGQQKLEYMSDLRKSNLLGADQLFAIQKN